MNTSDFNTLQQTHLTHLEQDMNKLITSAQLPQILQDACLYAVGAGGKRIRPLLALCAFIACGGQLCNEHHYALLRRASVALELLHGYSLIHDDLPCMDNDDLRRGRPTCHIAYGENTALLAGDALQSLATEALVDEHFLSYDSQILMSLLQIFTPRARRMVSGQMMDILGENSSSTSLLKQSMLEKIHQDKTGALIEASLMMGGICANASFEQLENLHLLGVDLGLVFQVQDDILDATADTTVIGKTAGSDDKLNKSTYVKLLGVDGARHYANQLFAKIFTTVHRIDTSQQAPLFMLIQQIAIRQK